MFYFELAVFCLIHLVSIVVAAKVLLTKHDSRSALGWCVTLIFLPVAGLLAYLIFGISRDQSKAEKIMRKFAAMNRKYYIFQSVDADGAPNGSEEHAMARLGRNLTGFKLSPNNAITPLHNGSEAYPAMLEAINQARRHVFLGTYIFNAGEVADKFIAALVAAMRRNVDVRVLVDGCGALYSRNKPWKRLERAGVKVTRFRPPRLFPRPDFGLNLRSHRKVLVCDNIGFTGGLNIADGNVPALAEREGIKPIQDMHFRFSGPVVSQLRAAFLLNWAFCTNHYTPAGAFRFEPDGDCKCRVVIDGPGNDTDVLNDLISGVINIAEKQVRIMTPYFLPSEELLGAIRSAAQRGVDVRVVLPGKNNLPFVAWATMRMLPSVLSAGVRVWEQPPPFAHTKLLAIDDFYCQVGSANLDARSMRLNFELNVEIYDRTFNAKIRGFIDSKIAAGHEITLHELQSLSIWRQLRNSACWIFYPYL